MTSQWHRGFTLVELLLVITILSIAFGVGLPSINNIVKHTHRKTGLHNLITGIHLARTIAISEQTQTTICPLNESDQCTRDWNLPITIFRDPEGLRRLTSNEALVRVINPPKRGTLTGNTGIRSHFGFNASGMARDAIGNILWCPDDANVTKAFQVIINMGGRPRLARDQNNNGIIEGSNGKDITCS